ncbi:acetyl-CoA acetyltransferase [Methyloceanibacter methanicus]|uniref:Acetyl-CoA acetyltransferase n=1 Tax=Methyloceanibacter methanicus TaxID=1774968 RepID=A0A1E3VZ67_9HYPH|nr:acetyl-CoA C-acetyltransferase [Methyloceanibacter methanicus]ODR98847.1 acetyl-CoA acetyltransferase [Methyloceanibacter methanicus]
MTKTELRRVAVLGGVRTPFCRSHTAYAELSNLDMLTTALTGLAERFSLGGAHIDEVVGGAVVTHAKDWNLAREAVIGSPLAQTTPGITMMQACGTSLQGALGLAAKIATGQIECGIAMGSDTTSDAPIVFQKKFAKRLVAASRAKSWGQRLAAFKGMSPGELAPLPPDTREPRTGLGMGEHCELMAKEWGISREDQDLLAYESHKKAAAAYDSGFMDDLVIPCAGVFRDNNIREDISLEKIAELKPVFDKQGGTITAANSTPLTDGAATALLASEEWADSRGIPVQAYLTLGRTSAVDYVEGEGLLMAPTVAVSDLLQQAGLALQDFDYYEIHEAFAAQVLATLKAWESETYCRDRLGRDAPLGSIDRTKLNVEGSSIAIGHPFAATGARILAVLAKLLHNGGRKRGLISVCTAGGMGVAAILEGVGTPSPAGAV